MSKQALPKSLFIALAIATLAFNTGCFSVTGPATETATPEKVGPGLAKCDLNGDLRIDASDIAYFAMATKADVNGDERADQADIDRIGSLFGQTYPEDLEGLTASELAQVARLIVADLNGDRAVTASDLVVFGMLQPMAERADCNGDGLVNERDLAKIEKNLGQTITPSVPA